MPASTKAETVEVPGGHDSPLKKKVALPWSSRVPVATMVPETWLIAVPEPGFRGPRRSACNANDGSWTQVWFGDEAKP